MSITELETMQQQEIERRVNERLNALRRSLAIQFEDIEGCICLLQNGSNDEVVGILAENVKMIKEGLGYDK